MAPVGAKLPLTVVALVVHAHVHVHNVALLQLAPVGDAVADDLIDGSAHRLRGRRWEGGWGGSTESSTRHYRATALPRRTPQASNAYEAPPAYLGEVEVVVWRGVGTCCDCGVVHLQTEEREQIPVSAGRAWWRAIPNCTVSIPCAGPAPGSTPCAGPAAAPPSSEAYDAVNLIRRDARADGCCCQVKHLQCRAGRQHRGEVTWHAPGSHRLR